MKPILFVLAGLLTMYATQPKIGGKPKLKLVMPDEELLTQCESDYCDIADYLTAYYKLVSDTEKIINDYNREYPEFNCEYYLYFEKGIKYKHYSCHEVGANKRVWLPYADIGDVRLILGALFDNAENDWNNDSTYLGAGEGIAGCHYEIIQKPDTIIIDSYCGC